MAGCEIHSVFAGVGGQPHQGLQQPRRGGRSKTREVAPERRRARARRGARRRAADGPRGPARPAAGVHRRRPGRHQEPVGMAGVRLEARVHIVTASIAAGRTSSSAATAPACTSLDRARRRSPRPRRCSRRRSASSASALVDIGAGTTDLLVFHGGAVRHTAVLPVGGNHVTERHRRRRCARRSPRRRSSSSATAARWRRAVAADEHGRGAERRRPRAARALAPRRWPRSSSRASRRSSRWCSARSSARGVDELLASGVVLTGGGAVLDGIVGARRARLPACRCASACRCICDGLGRRRRRVRCTRPASGSSCYGLEPRDAAGRRDDGTALESARRASSSG